jgi:hypothetical protein
MANLMPTIFIGHGNPMNAISKNVYTEGWAAIGKSIPRPKAVLSVSAHWYIPACAVTANLHHRQSMILVASQSNFTKSNILRPEAPNLPVVSKSCLLLYP